MQNGVKICTLIAVWASAVVFFTVSCLDYEKRPAAELCRLKSWPAESRIKRADGFMSLVLFLHPRCPCSSATLAELARLEAKVADQRRKQIKLKGYICFVIPKGCPADFCNSKLYGAAQKMRGFELLVDQDAYEAQAFQAKSSGASYLFDEQGKLLFHGGITAARGHEGDNFGKEQIQNYLLARRKPGPEAQTYPVYGCLLADPPAAGGK